MNFLMLLALACILVLPGSAAVASPTRPPLKVRDVIETTRAMADRNGEAVHVSPNGQRYAVMLVRGDVARDGVWAELRVGGLDTFKGAEPRVVARLFTRGLGGGHRRQVGSEALVHARRNAPRWLDDQRLALLWEDARSIRQVISVDVGSGQVEYLTHHATDVVHFNVHRNGTMVYGASVPCTLQPSEEDYRNGFAVKAVDAFELLQGCNAWERMDHELFVVSRSQAQPKRIEMSGGETVNRAAPVFPHVIFDASGQRALFATTVSDIPASWSAYRNEQFSAMLKSTADLEGGGYARQFRKLFLIDLERAEGKPLWEAPQEPYLRMRASWSPEGRAVVLGPTFLPIELADEAGLSGEAVAEVDIVSGAVRRIPLARMDAVRISSLRWCDADCIEVVSADRTLHFRREANEWKRAESPSNAASPRYSVGPTHLRVELRQGLNEPPALYARKGDSGPSRLLLDLNPDLTRKFALGRIEWLERERAGGQRWEGRLYYPANYQPGRRYPLVVQTHSLAPREEFTLSGRGGYSGATGPGVSVYLAQLLAGREMFVLHGRVRGFTVDVSYLDQTRIDVEQNEALIEELIAAGKVDRSRVGIMGYSATGWDVAYALTHSSFPYAAAITDDNKDGSYLQAAFSNWLYGATEEMIGAPPFGEGLKLWLERSPAFNAHRVQTPVLLTITSAGRVLSAWEMFSRLRHLHKPVEYYVIPNIERGSHGLQNPRQLLALQERALDWWCFWLKAEESPDPAKREQYRDWRRLRELHVQRVRSSPAADATE